VGNCNCLSPKTINSNADKLNKTNKQLSDKYETDVLMRCETLDLFQTEFMYKSCLIVIIKIQK